MDLELSKQNMQNSQIPKVTRIPWLYPLSAVFLAVVLFILTIIFIPGLSRFWFGNLELPPGAIRAIGAKPTYETFQGVFLQRKAFLMPGVFPLYGSSEMSMIVDYHPAKVFTPENGITPFLVGKGGTQTLIQALDIAALGDEVKGKKMAIFLTPQWYGPGGISQSTFAGNYSPLHIYEMFHNPTLSQKAKQTFALRLLNFPNAFNDYPQLKKLIQIQAKKEHLSISDKMSNWLPAQLEYSALALQDVFRAKFYVNKLSPQVLSYYAQTPSSFKPILWNQLRSEATEQGQKATGDNPFGMDQNYYLQHIQSKLNERKDSDKKAKLYPSQEYDDLQLLMKVLKEKGAKPLFVIMPMNGRWYNFTGFPEAERKACYQRLAQMVKGEGFPVADFSIHEQDDYYLRDPFHLAWKGWVDVDEALYQFYEGGFQG